jgi:hypothetical protein
MVIWARFGIIMVPQDRAGVIGWRSGSSASRGQHEMTPSRLASW